MTRILVTTDCSDLGHHALSHAQALARALHADLTVLSVRTEAGVAMAGEFGYLPPADPDQLNERSCQTEADLAARAPGARVRLEPAQGRSVAKVIVDVAREEGAAMIVMSTHGRSGLGRVLMGSVAEGVAHCAPVPVLLVRSGHTPPSWSMPPAVVVSSMEGASH